MLPETTAASEQGPVLAALYALFVWWFSTGIVLYLDGLPRRTFRWSLLGASAGAVLAVWAIAWSSTVPTVAGAYVAFTGAVLLWGWNETAFLMGFVTGPRKQACPEGCRGLRHFGHAAATLLYHEACLAASGAVVLALSWGAPNAVGAWTFGILWLMRLSTKLNVFLGVPNLTREFLPEHLGYLERYFTRKPMNLLFPLSVTGATLLTAHFVLGAFASGAGRFEGVAAGVLATLSALALLEHWFLVLPLPVARLWSWSLRSRTGDQRAGAAPTRLG